MKKRNPFTAFGGLTRHLVGHGEERGVRWGHGKLLRQNSEVTGRGLARSEWGKGGIEAMSL